VVAAYRTVGNGRQEVALSGIRTAAPNTVPPASSPRGSKTLAPNVAAPRLWHHTSAMLRLQDSGTILRPCFGSKTLAPYFGHASAPRLWHHTSETVAGPPLTDSGAIHTSSRHGSTTGFMARFQKRQAPHFGLTARKLVGHPLAGNWTENQQEMGDQTGEIRIQYTRPASAWPWTKRSRLSRKSATRRSFSSSCPPAT
jgi:hypothetical protein